MFLSLKIEEYNINVINLNFLIHQNFKTDFENFLYDNNLINIKINKSDYIKIINHFLIKNLLDLFQYNYYNIIIFNSQTEKNLEEEYIKYILDNIYKIVNKFSLNFFEIETEFTVDKNTIYKLKQIIESKKNKNFKKLIKFCSKNGLTKITNLITNNTKTKMLLHK